MLDVVLVQELGGGLCVAGGKGVDEGQGLVTLLSAVWVSWAGVVVEVSGVAVSASWSVVLPQFTRTPAATVRRGTGRLLSSGFSWGMPPLLAWMVWKGQMESGWRERGKPAGLSGSWL